MKKNVLFSACLILFVLLIAVSTLAVYKQNQYEISLSYTQEEAFSTLVSSINNLNYAMEKLSVSSSSSLIASSCSEIFRESTVAKTALALLPVYGSEHLDDLQLFISQAGSYSYDIIKRVSAGDSLSADDIENITNLKAYSMAVTLELNLVKSEINLGNISSNDYFTGEYSSETVSVFSDVNEDFQGYPSLIYDGPFSAHLDNVELVFLSDKASVSQDEAFIVASLYMENPVFSYESAGTIPCFTFSNGESSISITKNGAYVLSYLSSKMPTSQSISIEDGMQKAYEALENFGFSSMKDSYYSISNGIMTVNFAYYEDDILYYPDLVKVSIYLDTGEVASMESSGYLMCHTTRSTSDFVSIDTARKSVSSTLNIVSENLVLVPSDGNHEVYCYEFVCHLESGSISEDYIVYVDAITGQEYSILILIIDENGTLTI